MPRQIYITMVRYMVAIPQAAKEYAYGKKTKAKQRKTPDTLAQTEDIKKKPKRLSSRIGKGSGRTKSDPDPTPSKGWTSNPSEGTW